MSNTESHTIRLLQEMRAEMREGFERLNCQFDDLERQMKRFVAVRADPDDPEDFDVTVEGLEQGLRDRADRP